MTPLIHLIARTRWAALAASAFALMPGHAAAVNDFAQKPEIYICPNASGGAVDCFLDAVPHLYTMCRQVKSIEIIEFGYEMAEQGVNGAKSEYCLDKHKVSMTRPYQAALREATRSGRAAVEALRSLHDLWQKALAELKWHPPESDDEYKVRVAKPYDSFREHAEAVRTALASAQTAIAAKSSAKRQPPAAKTAAATKPAH